MLTVGAPQAGASNCAPVWKQFCRLLEDKAVRRFLRTQPADVDACSLFEFTREQSELAVAEAELDKVPPFPFERVAVVHWNGCAVLWEPVLDGDALLCRIVAFWTRTNEPTKTEAVIAEATVAVSHLEGTPRRPPECLDARALFFDEAGRITSRAPGDDVRPYEPPRHARAPALADTMARIRDLEQQLADTRQRVAAAAASALANGLYRAFKNVAWINRPGHYVARRGAGASATRDRSPDRIRRLPERPVHIVLTHEQIERGWHGTHGGGSKMPHLRRGHYRVLRSEMWTNKRGQTVWVRPARVGGEQVEWRAGDTHYVVVG